MLATACGFEPKAVYIYIYICLYIKTCLELLCPPSLKNLEHISKLYVAVSADTVQSCHVPVFSCRCLRTQRMFLFIDVYTHIRAIPLSSLPAYMYIYIYNYLLTDAVYERMLFTDECCLIRGAF